MAMDAIEVPSSCLIQNPKVEENIHNGKSLGKDENVLEISGKQIFFLSLKYRLGLSKENT